MPPAKRRGKSFQERGGGGEQNNSGRKRRGNKGDSPDPLVLLFDPLVPAPSLEPVTAFPGLAPSLLDPPSLDPDEAVFPPAALPPPRPGPEAFAIDFAAVPPGPAAAAVPSLLWLRLDEPDLTPASVRNLTEATTPVDVPSPSEPDAALVPPEVDLGAAPPFPTTPPPLFFVIFSNPSHVSAGAVPLALIRPFPFCVMAPPPTSFVHGCRPPFGC